MRWLVIEVAIWLTLVVCRLKTPQKWMSSFAMAFSLWKFSSFTLYWCLRARRHKALTPACLASLLYVFASVLWHRQLSDTKLYFNGVQSLDENILRMSSSKWFLRNAIKSPETVESKLAHPVSVRKWLLNMCGEPL